MTTDAAISALIAAVKNGRGVADAGADDRGSESAGGSVSLRFEDGMFVLENMDWHESNGFRDRESLTRWTRSESGLFELLKTDRRLLKSLLRVCEGLRPGTPPHAPALSTDPSAGPAGRGSVEAILGRLEGGAEWFLLAVTPTSHEEALVYRPWLGWQCLETDCARDVELESVVRSLKPPPGDATIDARDRCAAGIQAALRARPGADAERLPAQIEAQLESVEAKYGSALQQLRAGAWWLADGRASGLVGGRGVTIEYRDALIAEVVTRDAPLLEEFLLAAIVRSTPVVFGDPPPPLQAILQGGLDMAALTARVQADEAAVQREDAAERAAERARERQRARLVEEALVLAADRPVTESTEQGYGSESARHERELRRREDGLFVLVQRTSRIRASSAVETDERRLIEGESGMRGGLAGWSGESLERAVAAARTEPR